MPAITARSIVTDLALIASDDYLKVLVPPRTGRASVGKWLAAQGWGDMSRVDIEVTENAYQTLAANGALRLVGRDWYSSPALVPTMLFPAVA